MNIRKNLPRLFRALKNCSHDIPLVCVGKKDWKSEPLERIVEKLQMKNRIIFTGFIPDEEIPLFLNTARGFIFVSFAEGFGIPPLEAMACGTPVIASNTTSLPEVIGDAGLLVNPESEEEITNAIDKLLGDNSLQADLKDKGLRRAEKRRWENSACILVNLWDKFQ
jgi:glycosyltransferase involved in cell wall biosynthesis